MRRLILNAPVRCHLNPDTGREGRRKVTIPPAGRIVKRPVEDLILKLASSDRVIGVATKVAARRKSQEPSDG